MFFSCSQPLLSLVADGRPRVYSKLPAFPTVGGTHTHTYTHHPSPLTPLPLLPQENASAYDSPARPRLENPYDTMEGDRSRTEFSETGVYSTPGDITSESPHHITHHTILPFSPPLPSWLPLSLPPSASTEEGVYDNGMMTIKQAVPATPNIPDRIELTPPLQRVNPIYGNAGTCC